MPPDRLTPADLEAVERLYEMGLFGTGDPRSLVAECRALTRERDDLAAAIREAVAALGRIPNEDRDVEVWGVLRLLRAALAAGGG